MMGRAMEGDTSDQAARRGVFVFVDDCEDGGEGYDLLVENRSYACGHSLLTNAS